MSTTVNLTTVPVSVPLLTGNQLMIVEHTGGNMVYYRSTSNVSAQANDGVLTLGQTTQFYSGPVWFASDSTAQIIVTYISSPISPAMVVADSTNAGASDQAFGRNYPTVTGGDDRPELESLLAAGQTDIQLRTGTYSIQASIFGIAGKSNVKIRGAGINRTIVRPTPTTGNIFDLTGSSFCEISDMSIVPTAQRTAGSMILLDAGGGSCQQNNLRRLLLSSSFIGISLINCSTTLIEDIQIGDLNAAWGWQSAIFVNGAAVSTTVNRLRGGTAAGMSSGIVRLNASAIDTFHGNDWDVLNQTPSTGMVGLFIAGGTWTTLNQCSIESGDQQSLTTTGGTGTHLANCHWLGQMLISGGNDLQIRGGTNVIGGALPVRMTAGVGTSIDGLTVHDAPTGAVCIRADNGISDFKVVNCDLGRAILGTGGIVATLVQVGTSANAQDRYIVDLNTGRNFSGTALIDNGTGTNKRVGAVPTSNVFVA